MKTYNFFWKRICLWRQRDVERKRKHRKSYSHSTQLINTVRKNMWHELNVVRASSMTSQRGMVSWWWRGERQGVGVGVRGPRLGGRGFAGVSSRSMIYAHVNTRLGTRLTVTYGAQMSAHCLIVCSKAKVYYEGSLINNETIDSFVFKCRCQVPLTPWWKAR